MEEARREHHPRLQQTNLTIACNVTADPAPDVNWARGRTVLSKYDSKVGECCVVVCPQSVLQDKYEMRTSKRTTGLGSQGETVVRQFSLIIKDIREEDYKNN